MSRIRRLLAGLGALVVLAALVGGVPAGLALGIGWPLPHALPDWAQLQADLSAPIPDAALLKALACVVWVGWAILAAAVAAEAAAAIRGHAARRLPLAGALQPFAGHLVAAVAFALVSLTLRPTTGTTAPLSAALLAAHPGITAGATAVPRGGQPSSPPTPQPVNGTPVATPPGAIAGRVYVVRRGDTLWGIAAAQLGDPLRWRAIYALNDGRPQPGGATLTDPNDIWPGWTLILPADASPPPIAAAAPNGNAAHPAAHRPSVPARPSAPPVSSSPAAPTRPAATAPADTSPRSRSAPADARPGLPAHHQPDSDPARAAPGPMVELLSGSAVALGLAAAIGAALAAARLQQRRRYRPGQARPGVAATEPLAGPTVRRLRRAHLDLLDAMDTATAGPAAEPRGAPDRRPVAALPPGWVQAGQRAGAPLVLDLLADPGLGLVGPGAEGTARGLAVALLADAGANRAELLATAETAGLLGRGDTTGVEIAADLAGALGRLEVEIVHRSRLLDAHDTDHLAGLAAAHPEEPLGPLILLAPAPPPGGGQRLQAVLALGRRLGIGAVLLGAWPTGLTLTVATDGTIEQVAGENAAELVGARLGTLTETEAAELLGVLAAARPGPQPEAVGSGKAAPEASSEQWIEPPPQPEQPGVARPVELRLLGPVRILAGGEEIDTGLRSKARELLAYLATRPQGVSDEAAVEALWPDAPPGRGMEQFHTAVGNLRKVLRAASGLGEAMFVEHTAGRYRIDPALVDVDLWPFQNHLGAAGGAADDDSERAAALTAAAGLYSGELAEGARYDWAEPLREQLRRQAVDVLTDLAELRETRGDVPGALALAEQAMNVDLYAEAVYRQVMRLQVRLGRPDAVVRTYRLLELRLTDIDAEPEPLTRQLLAELYPHKPSRPRAAADLGSTAVRPPLSSSRTPTR